MSAHIVVRRGTGRLHIAEPDGGAYLALCGSRITAPAGGKLHTWTAGRAARAVWAEWPCCAKCARRDRELRQR